MITEGTQDIGKTQPGNHGVGKAACALQKACLTEREMLKTLNVMYNKD